MSIWHKLSDSGCPISRFDLSSTPTPTGLLLTSRAIFVKLEITFWRQHNLTWTQPKCIIDTALVVAFFQFHFDARHSLQFARLEYDVVSVQIDNLHKIGLWLGNKVAFEDGWGLIHWGADKWRAADRNVCANHRLAELVLGVTRVRTKVIVVDCVKAENSIVWDDLAVLVQPRDLRCRISGRFANELKRIGLVGDDGLLQLGDAGQI